MGHGREKAGQREKVGQREKAGQKATSPLTRITVLKYSGTNTYLLEGEKGTVLFDTGWAGNFQAFCSELGRNEKKLGDIDYILISHFHPDHYGIAQEIADRGR